MDLSSISRNSGSSTIDALQNILAQKKTAATDNDSGDSSDSTSISKPGELISMLQQLQDEDPDKFQETVKALADKVSKSADEADGGEKKMLTDLASALGEVADTGDLSALSDALMPPEPPSGEGMSLQGKQAVEAYQGQKPSGPPPDGEDPRSSMDSVLSSLISVVSNALTEDTATSMA